VDQAYLLPCPYSKIFVPEAIEHTQTFKTTLYAKQGNHKNRLELIQKFMDNMKIKIHIVFNHLDGARELFFLASGISVIHKSAKNFHSLEQILLLPVCCQHAMTFQT